jgi:hypothetical protein
MDFKATPVTCVRASVESDKSVEDGEIEVDNRLYTYTESEDSAPFNPTLQTRPLDSNNLDSSVNENEEFDENKMLKSEPVVKTMKEEEEVIKEEVPEIKEEELRLRPDVPIVILKPELPFDFDRLVKINIYDIGMDTARAKRYELGINKLYSTDEMQGTKNVVLWNLKNWFAAQQGEGYVRMQFWMHHVFADEDHFRCKICSHPFSLYEEREKHIKLEMCGG